MTVEEERGRGFGLPSTKIRIFWEFFLGQLSNFFGLLRCGATEQKLGFK